MPKNTLIIVGPGGVGKGPLTRLIRANAVALDPHRLRTNGPRRESNDPLYAPPKFRLELLSVLSALGDSLRDIPCETEKLEWCPKSKVLLFTVRGEWQCLILYGLENEIAKAELYAPIIPAILGITEISKSIGKIKVIVLNPSKIHLSEMSSWTDLQEITRENCKRRGDSSISIAKRVSTIPIEAPAWRALIADYHAIEITNWQFSEYRFKVEDNRHLLIEARRTILNISPELDIFFKNEGEI